MRYTIALIFAGLFVSAGHAQHSGFCLGKKIVFEANYIGSGMSGIVGRHVISRVCTDRTVQYDEAIPTRSGEKYILKKRTLSKDRFDKLMQLLQSDEASSLRNEYPAATSTIDHSEDLLLSISIDNTKTIKVNNFKPDISSALKTYPLLLVKLSCSANAVRGSSETKFFFRESKICANLR
jgi:hypothetical protein